MWISPFRLIFLFLLVLLSVCGHWWVGATAYANHRMEWKKYMASRLKKHVSIIFKFQRYERPSKSLLYSISTDLSCMKPFSKRWNSASRSMACSYCCALSVATFRIISFTTVGTRWIQSSVVLWFEDIFDFFSSSACIVKEFDVSLSSVSIVKKYSCYAITFLYSSWIG